MSGERFTDGPTANHPYDFDSHDLLISRFHHHCPLDLLAQDLPRHHSTCRLRPLRKLCRRQGTLLGDGWVFALEEQVMARHHELRYAGTVRGRRKEGGPMDHLPRQVSRVWRQSRIPRRLVQSVQH
jgi:hypothetical protein